MEHVARIAMSGDNTIFILRSGEVLLSGNSEGNILGLPYEPEGYHKEYTNDVYDVIDASMSISHTLLLRRDGKVYGAGDNTYGQLVFAPDEEGEDEVIKFILLPIDNVIGISVGINYSLFLKRDGTVWICGRNDYITTSGERDIISPPEQVSNLPEIVSIHASDNTAFFISADGSLYARGLYQEEMESSGEDGKVPRIPQVVKISLSPDPYGLIEALSVKGDVISLDGSESFVPQSGVRDLAITSNTRIYLFENGNIRIYHINGSITYLSIPNAVSIIADSYIYFLLADGSVLQMV